MDNKPRVYCSKEEGRTKQKTGMEHDINKLVARYQKTGVLETKHDDNGLFVDVAVIGDYHECMNRIAIANERFNMLPSRTRARFNNDPAQLLDFISNLNKDSVQEAVKLGLITTTEVDTLKEKKPIINTDPEGDPK